MGEIDIEEAAKVLDTHAMKIIVVVSRLTDVSIREMRGKTRASDAVEARRIAMVLIRQKLHYTCARIGRMFKRDHSTALHAFKVHDDLMEVDKHYQEFFSVCATSVGLEKLADANDRQDIILKMGARIEYLESENKDLKKQIDEIKFVLI